MEFSDPSLIQRRVSTPRVNKTDSEGSSIKGVNHLLSLLSQRVFYFAIYTSSMIN